MKLSDYKLMKNSCMKPGTVYASILDRLIFYFSNLPQMIDLDDGRIYSHSLDLFNKL